VHVATDMRVTGPAAQFGRGVMQDVSAKLMGRFADCLAEEIAAAGPAPAAAAAAAPEGTSTVGPRRPAATPPAGPAGDSAEAAVAEPAPPVRRTEEVLDLGAASREAVLKRVAPVVVGVAGLVVLLGVLRRRR
jgi:hypothetical protein